jgi:hypothetical protein
MPIDPAPDSPITSPDADQDPDCLSDFTAQVKATAYLLWEQAGQPAGRKDYFWYKALDQHISARANAEKLDKEPPPLS